MTQVRHTRFRRTVAVWLLASLATGLAAPVIAARSQGVTSIYAQWLGDRLGDRSDDRTDGVMDRLALSTFPTLRTYVVSFVQDLVEEEGLEEAARMLDAESPSSAGDLARSFLEGLRSLSPERLPEATLLPESNLRAVSLDRSAGVSPSIVGAAKALLTVRSLLRPVVAGMVAEGRPASGGAQPLGP